MSEFARRLLCLVPIFGITRSACRKKHESSAALDQASMAPEPEVTFGVLQDCCSVHAAREGRENDPSPDLVFENRDSCFAEMAADGPETMVSGRKNCGWCLDDPILESEALPALFVEPDDSQVRS